MSSTASPNQCLFCSATNLPYAEKCFRCGRVTIPTRDSQDHNKEIKWTTFSFYPNTLAHSGTGTHNLFATTRGSIWGEAERVAIRADATDFRFILVRGRDPPNVKPENRNTARYSVKMSTDPEIPESENTPGLVETWERDNTADATRFDQVIATKLVGIEHLAGT
ncbi:hypothetical protein PVAG01_06838 [Phlyctema vagabunda]|uniref:RanBP2-type domain-containing protein n=1 Tax=Phlyctema vagabunda TaxID=108571 RepID=A0ABR4PH71_9HELO